MVRYTLIKKILRFIYIILNNFIYFIRCNINSFQIIKNNDFKNFYIPNFLINNIIHINPMKIKYKGQTPLKFKKKSTPFILNFSWDQKKRDLKEFEKEHHTYVTCKELFIRGKHIKECKEFFFFKEQIKKFGCFKDFKNENDIILYLEKLLDLFQNIKKNGIKTYINNNLEFMIDENFNLVKIGGGNHRFAISRILKLKQIPIEIKLINIECLKKKFTSKISKNDLNNIIKNIETKYN